MLRTARLCVAAWVCAAAADARSEPSRGPVLVVVSSLSPATQGAIDRLQSHPGLSLVRPAPAEVPTRDELLAPVRRAYARMDFTKTIAALQAAERRLIEGQRPSPEHVARLAEIEMFYGACLAITHDRRAAEERFVLARTLAATLRPDPMFPPEVTTAFDAARPAAAVAVRFEVAPEDGRLWIDGAQVSARPVSLPAGLHHLVVERADRKPAARLLRVSKASSKIELAAITPLDRAAALAVLNDPSADDRGRILISALFETPVWRIEERDGGLDARRYAAADVAHPMRQATLARGDLAALERTICDLDACDPPPQTAAATARRPLWRRAWFWAAVGGGGAILAGVIAGAVVATSPRDYSAVPR